MLPVVENLHKNGNHHVSHARSGWFLFWLLMLACFHVGAQAPATPPAVTDPAAVAVAPASAPAAPASLVATPPAPTVAAPAAAAMPALPAPMTRPGMVPTDTINGADTAWMMTSTALVLLMTLPGIALFMAAWCARKMFSTQWPRCRDLSVVSLLGLLWAILGVHPWQRNAGSLYRRH